MEKREQEQAELLESYLEALAEDAQAEPGELLEAPIARTAEALAILRPPEPQAAFAEDLRRRVEAQAAAMAQGRQGASPRPGYRWRLVGAAAAVIVIALAGSISYLATQRAQKVDAREILARVEVVSRDVSASGVRSFEMTQVTVSSQRTAEAPGEEKVALEVRSEARVQYRAPTEWKAEVKTESPGQEPEPPRVTAAQGETVWTYEPRKNTVEISSAESAPSKEAPVLASAPALADTLKDVTGCYSPSAKGEDKVAGRPAYIVDLGESKCSSKKSEGSTRLWVDKETSFVLKAVVLDPQTKLPLRSMEVSEIKYNAELPKDAVAYSPPPGSRVLDSRPKPSSSHGQVHENLALLVKQADFTVFVPMEIPAGLAPRRPRLDAKQGLLLEYVPPEEVEKTTVGTLNGVRIVQQPAAQGLVTRWTEGAEGVSVNGVWGWLRRGVRTPDGRASDSAAILVRDGTIISVSSLALSAEDLLKVAASLSPVGKGEASPTPTPSPTPGQKSGQ